MHTTRLNFRSFVTPKLLVLLWWGNVGVAALIMGLLLIGFIGMRIEGLPDRWFVNVDSRVFLVGVLLLGLGLLALRIWMEFLAIVFSIYDRLLNICEKLDPPPNFSPTPRTPQFVYRGARKESLR